MKFQIPSSKLQRNFKRQASTIPPSIFGGWLLDILWSLELGFWSFPPTLHEGEKP
jgi:hypothetical protein